MPKKHLLSVLFLGILFIALPAHAGSSALSAVPAPPSAQVFSAGPAPVSEPMDAQKILLSEVQGEVFIKKAGAADFSSVRSGASLEAGDTLKTGNGSCEIVFDDKSHLSIASDTEIVITEALKNIAANTRTTLLKLGLGKLKAKITKVTPGSRFEIMTPSAVAAVRGTTLVLQSLLLNGKYISNLYVDESKSGVQFTNTETGDSQFVPPYSDSSSSDGSVEEPKDVTEEEKNDYNEGFEEGDSLSDSGDPLGETGDPNAGQEEVDDAALDKTSEQDTSGGAAQDAIDEAAQDTGIDEAERLMITQEIALLTGDRDFSHADANLAQVSDAQTGKVMTDVHGNRVRVDQYVFKEAQGKGGDIVKFLSLTARTGQYQNGVTSVLFGAAFNTTIDVPIRDLPWDEYLNSVRSEDLLPVYDPSIYNVDNPAPPFNEFIVHESADTSSTSLAPSLYPTEFFVWFANPVRAGGARDTVGFEEFYSDPLKVHSDSIDSDFWVQGRTVELANIQSSGGLQVISGRTIAGQSVVIPGLDNPISGDFLVINGVVQYSGIPTGGPSTGGDNGGDGSQTASFASNFVTNHINLMAPNSVEYYRSLPINNDGDPDNDDHPAYFDDKYGTTGYSLIGVFIPINDAGQIYDVPGFRVNSMRGLISPNTQVNGGNYNLESIFFFGTQNVETDEFQELFRIDAIITPEILSDIGTVNQSDNFPSQLYPDEDDYNYGTYV